MKMNDAELRESCASTLAEPDLLDASAISGTDGVLADLSGDHLDSMAFASQIVEKLTSKGHSVATAESLTAGLVSAAIADIPGASNCLSGGVTTYQTHTKASVLGVDEGLLQTSGPVDPDVALQMAAGAARLFGSTYGVATTGVAGPGPAEGHAAGTVYVAVWSPARSNAVLYHFEGDRASVRAQAAEAALAELLKLL